MHTLVDDFHIINALKGNNYGENGFPIINLFDCIDDPNYDKMLKELPQKYLIG